MNVNLSPVLTEPCASITSIPTSVLVVLVSVAWTVKSTTKTAPRGKIPDKFQTNFLNMILLNNSDRTKRVKCKCKMCFIKCAFITLCTASEALLVNHLYTAPYKGACGRAGWVLNTTHYDCCHYHRKQERSPFDQPAQRVQNKLIKVIKIFC